MGLSLCTADPTDGNLSHPGINQENKKVGYLSFAGVLPAPDGFPVEKFSTAGDRVLQKQGAIVPQYSTMEGCLPLSEIIARHSARYGIKISTKNGLITSGSQQALYLFGENLDRYGRSDLVDLPS